MSDFLGMIFVLLYVAMTLSSLCYLVVNSHPWWALIPMMMIFGLKFHHAS